MLEVENVRVDVDVFAEVDRGAQSAAGVEVLRFVDRAANVDAVGGRRGFRSVVANQPTRDLEFNAGCLAKRLN